jgi:hypothetical protein
MAARWGNTLKQFMALPIERKPAGNHVPADSDPFKAEVAKVGPQVVNEVVVCQPVHDSSQAAPFNPAHFLWSAMI